MKLAGKYSSLTPAQKAERKAQLEKSRTYSKLSPAERQAQLKKSREERKKEQSNQERFLTAEQKAKRKERFAESKKPKEVKRVGRKRPDKQ